MDSQRSATHLTSEQPSSRTAAPVSPLAEWLPAPGTLWRFLLLFASGWALIQIVQYFYTVIALFTVAAILAVLLNVPVRRLSTWMPRWLAILLTVVTMALVLLGAVSSISLQLGQQTSGMLADLEHLLRHSQLPYLQNWRTIDLDRAVGLVFNHFGSGIGVVGGAASSLIGLIFLLVITVYMLVDQGATWHALINLLPLKLREPLRNSVAKNLLGFLRGQLALMLFLTTSNLIGFLLMGVKFSLLLAIILGVLDAIPGIGATLGVIVISLLVLVIQGQAVASAVLIQSLILLQVQDNIIRPRVMGKALQISPIVLFFALFVGERLAGLLGLLLAIPIAGMIVGWKHEVHPGPISS